MSRYINIVPEKKNEFDVEGPGYVKPRVVNGEDDAVRIVGEAQKNNDLKRIMDAYDKSLKGSTVKTKVEYNPDKKKIRTKFVALALCSIALVSSLTVYEVQHIKADALDTDVAISIISDDRVTDVNRTIAAYQLLMSTTGPNEYRIENAYEYNYKNNDFDVDYNPGTLYKVVIDAAKESEVKARCAILAAYKEINEPYRKQQFDLLFDKIARDQELSSELPSFMVTGSCNGFLKSLGYENLEQYQESERQSIKDLFEEEFVSDAIGRR